MGDPKLEALGSKADPFATAETMGQQHRCVAGEAAVAALEQERQPRMEGVGAEAPQPHLGHFGELAGIIVQAGPDQLQIELSRCRDQAGHRGLRQGSQGAEIEVPNLVGANGECQGQLHRRRGHQEL